MVRFGDCPSDVFDARCVLMFDVTCQTLRSDPDLRLCEGLRLIDATRIAVSRLAPGCLEKFDSHVLPHMRSILMDRFGLPELPNLPIN